MYYVLFYVIVSLIVWASVRVVSSFEEEGDAALYAKFVWYDVWVGLYIDVKTGCIYVCMLPCFVIKCRVQ